MRSLLNAIVLQLRHTFNLYHAYRAILFTHMLSTVCFLSKSYHK